VPADLIAISISTLCLVRDASARNHQNTVGELQHFIEILAYQQHRRAAIAGAQDLATDISGGGGIEAETWILHDEQSHIARKFAGQHRALHVASR